MKLRGKREEHVGFLQRWFENLDGAELVATSSTQTSLGVAGQRLPGAETIEVRMREGGRLLVLLECDGRAANLAWSRSTHLGLGQRAIKALYERFGGPP